MTVEEAGTVLINLRTIKSSAFSVAVEPHEGEASSVKIEIGIDTLVKPTTKWTYSVSPALQIIPLFDLFKHGLETFVTHICMMLESLAIFFEPGAFFASLDR